MNKLQVVGVFATFFLISFFSGAHAQLLAVNEYFDGQCDAIATTGMRSWGNTATQRLSSWRSPVSFLNYLSLYFRS
jgi:hypothetical protein